MLPFALTGLLIFNLGCGQEPSGYAPPETHIEEPTEPVKEKVDVPDGPYVLILGVAQDAGYPQADCQKECCERYWSGENNAQEPVALAIIDPESNKSWMIEATPEIKYQLYQLDFFQPNSLQGVFLTHAHIGHYSGLMHFGREVMGANGIPVYAMPRMKTFLETNGPWDQLVELNNISINPLENEKEVELTEKISITPILVPHRDEYSETVGFRIKGPKHSVLFIPDINKWDQWNKNIVEEVKSVDHALLDATFFANGEIPGRDMSEIPHPFVEESMQLFDSLPDLERQKICFIHFNHTNPLIYDDSVRNVVVSKGYEVAIDGRMIEL